MSHLRISTTTTTTLSPQIPLNRAHMVVSMEPTETLRVLEAYGNPGVRVICNTRPTHPIGVISGRLDYPTMDEIRDRVSALSCQA